VEAAGPSAEAGGRSRLWAIVEIALVLLVLGFLVGVIVTQWDELRDRDVRFDPVWLLAAVPVLGVFYALSAFIWSLLLRALGQRIPEVRAQSVWARSLLARYVPGGVVMVLGRVVYAGREGVPARVTLASMVYEISIAVASATIVSAYPVIASDALSVPAKAGLLAVVPIAVALLHPRVFGPIANSILRLARREPLPALIPLRTILGLLALTAGAWAVGGAGMFFAGLSVYPMEAADLPVVIAALAIGFSAAAALVVFPGGLGVRDAAFASLVGTSVPGGFATGATIAIAARLVSTLVEVVYAAAAVSLARRDARRSTGP
jgi:uncharacterized membrane protein YbhN (UPF0104 family)